MRALATGPMAGPGASCSLQLVPRAAFSPVDRRADAAPSEHLHSGSYALRAPRGALNPTRPCCGGDRPPHVASDRRGPRGRTSGSPQRVTVPRPGPLLAPCTTGASPPSLRYVPTPLRRSLGAASARTRQQHGVPTGTRRPPSMPLPREHPCPPPQPLPKGSVPRPS